MSDQEKDILTNFLDNTSSKDAFEKEALEGFKSIGSKEEIIELKKKTDAQAELLFQKKANKPLVWVAAAILIITFGLIIKFFLPSNDLIKDNDLALHEKTVTGAQEVKSAEPAAPNVIDLKNEDQFIENKPLSRVDSKKDEVVKQEQSPNESPIGKLSSLKEDVKSTKDVEEEEVSADVALVSEAAKSESFAGGVPFTSTGSVREASDKDALAKESKRNEKSKKKSALTIEPTNAPASPGKVKLEDDLNESESNLFYIGGDKALITDLREKLKIIQLNSPFDALITITDEKKITIVEFVDERDLSKDELKQIKNEIKSLEKFDFKVPPTKKTKFTYKIIYRP
ncbi:MAG: hypothetical protein ACK5QC_08155 [Bacteroidota bacterium]